MSPEKQSPLILPQLTDQKKQELIEEKQILKTHSDLELQASSFSVLDADSHRVLTSHKGRRVQEMASLTKIMTCYVICHRIEVGLLPQNCEIQVSKSASLLIGTTASLRSGDRISLINLLYGLMLPSGNDAAYTLAEHVGRQLFCEDIEYKMKLEENPGLIVNVRSRDALKCFIAEMNRVAKSLGLEHTHYANPHGLVNKYNKSSASDQCKLTAIAMKNDLFRKIVQTKLYKCQILSKIGIPREVTWYNTNKLLALDECIGVKTGITPTAGPCLASYFHKKGRNIVIVIFKAFNIEDRFRETWILYQWVCNKLKLLSENEKRIDFENQNLQQLLKQYEEQYKLIPKLDLSTPLLDLNSTENSVMQNQDQAFDHHTARKCNNGNIVLDFVED